MRKESLDIKGIVKYNEPMFKHTTFRIGGPANMWVEPRDAQDLRKILLFARERNIKIFVIGCGSNILVQEKGFDGIVVNLSGNPFCKIEIKGTSVKTGSGALLSHLVMYSCKSRLDGLIGLAGIPGTVGGALHINAGYTSNIGDVVRKIKVMDVMGKSKVLEKKDLHFGYRSSNLAKYIILEAEFRLRKITKGNLINEYEHRMKLKRKTQPLDKRSAGCVFKNPPHREKASAGEVIEFSGLKGTRCGGAEVSRKHANFIINSKFATSKDVIHLVELIRRRVKEKAGIDLRLELIII